MCSKEDICNLLPWKGISNKDLEIHYCKGGHGACPLKLKHVCKPIYLKRRNFATFYTERGSPTNIWKYIIAKGVRGLAPWSWSISCKFGCSKEDICNLLPWNGISNKNLELHAPWSLNIFLNSNVKKRTFVAFYPETWSPGNTWKYIIAKGVRGLVPWSWSICVNPFYIERRVSNRDPEIYYSKGPPEAAAFCVNLDFQRRKFVTFSPERVGSPTKIWKYIIAKGVRGLAPWSWSIF